MHVAALLGVVFFTLLPLAEATVFVPKWSSCFSAYQPVADGMAIMQVENVLATIVPGGQAWRQNLVGDHDDVLRIDLLGRVATNITGYNQTTGKLGEWWVCGWVLEMGMARRVGQCCARLSGLCRGRD